MSLSSSFGLDAEIERKFREKGPVFNPTVVPWSRELFVDSFDETLPENGKRLNDVSYGEHERHMLDICLPGEAARPIVLFVPGGGMTAGNKSMYAHIPAFFARRGYVGVAANYRLAPDYLFPAGAEDIARAIDWLVDNQDVHQGDVNNIFLIGQSAGAVHMASTVLDKRFQPANQDRIRAVILMSGVYDIVPDHVGGNINLYFGNDADQLRDRSSVNNVAGSTVPVILTVTELEPAFFGESTGAMVKALSARDGKAPQVVWLKGHNHLSPVLNMGSATDQLGDAFHEVFQSYLAPQAG